MIPKIIHFVWIGSKLPGFASACINRFRELNHDYQIKVHDERILRDTYRQVYDQVRNICSKADLLRLSALKEFGGWYFDTDFYPLRRVDDIYKVYQVDDRLFLTRQSETDSAKHIANGIIGIGKNSQVWQTIDSLVDQLRNAPKKRTIFGPQLMTKLVQLHPELCVVGRREDFYPYSFREKRRAFRQFRSHIRSANQNPVSHPGSPFCFHLWAGGKEEIPVPPSLKLPGRKTLVIVGNYRGNRGDYCYAINSSDYVIRINRCLGFGDEQGRMGYKTDALGLVSSGSGAKPFTRTIRYMKPSGRVGRQISEVWFTRPKSWTIGNRHELSERIIEAQDFNRFEIKYPTENTWGDLDQKLKKLKPNFIVPSTGMILIEMVLADRRFDEFEKYIVGFSHEGSAVHPFDAEKTIIAQYVAEGILNRVEDFLSQNASMQHVESC